LYFNRISIIPLQLEDDHTIFDYDVGLSDIVQLMIRVNVPDVKDTTQPSTSIEYSALDNNDEVSVSVLVI
jgi:hypothetical protein